MRKLARLGALALVVTLVGGTPTIVTAASNPNEKATTKAGSSWVVEVNAAKELSATEVAGATFVDENGKEVSDATSDFTPAKAISVEQEIDFVKSLNVLSEKELEKYADISEKCDKILGEAKSDEMDAAYEKVETLLKSIPEIMSKIDKAELPNTIIVDGSDVKEITK